MPAAVLSFAYDYGGGSSGVRIAVLQYLAIFVTAAALIDLLLLPLLPYSDNSKNDAEALPLVSDDPEDGPGAKDGKSVVPAYWSYSLKNQLLTADYWIYVVLFILMFCRKKHFSVLIRSILSELDSDPEHSNAHFYSDMYNTIVPGGFIPAILWGALVDRFGILPLLFVSNTLGLLSNVLSMVPCMHIQIVTIGVFIIYQSFVFGQALAFMSCTYGFTTIATLQGIASSFVGIFSIMMDFFWPSFINNTLGSYRKASLVWVVVGVAMYLLPLMLMVLERRRSEDLIKKPDVGVLDTTLPMISCFDRNSLEMLGRQKSLVTT